MLNNIQKSLYDSSKSLLLASSCFLSTMSLSSPGQEASVNGESQSPAAQKIPPEIIAEARLKGIPLTAIKLEDNTWVACISEKGKPDACQVLGASRTSALQPEKQVMTLEDLRNGDSLAINRYGKKTQEFLISLTGDVVGETYPDLGKVEKKDSGNITFSLNAGVEARVSLKNRPSIEVIDTLPQYVKEGENLVRTKDFTLVNNYLAKYPDESFLVIVTVPAECPPCRDLDLVLQNFYTDPDTKAERVKTFIVEFFDFATPKQQVLGERGVFPTILALKSRRLGTPAEPLIKGDLMGATEQEILTPIGEKVRWPAGPQLVIRGGVVREKLRDVLRSLKNRD